MLLGLLGLVGGVLWWGLFSRPVSDLAFVPGDAEVVGFVRVADLWNTDVVRNTLQDPKWPDVKAGLEDWLGLPPADIERVILVVAESEKNRYWILVSTSRPYDRNRIEGLMSEAINLEHERNTILLGTLGNGQAIAVHYASKQLLLVGSVDGVKQALNYAAGNKSKGPIDGGIQRAREKHPIVVSFSEPFKQTLPGTARLRALVTNDGQALLSAHSGTVVLDIDRTLDLEANLQFDSSKEATAGRKNVEQLVGSGKTGVPLLRLKMYGPEGVKLADPFESALDSVRMEQRDQTLLIKARAEAEASSRGLALLAPVLQPLLLWNSAAGPTNQKNLQRIGEALLVYANLHGGRLPPATIFDSTGQTPLYSWRVEILPWLNEQELFNEFRRNEPWDSPHNKRLLTRMPQVYAQPGENQAGEPTSTPYQVFTGPGAPFADRKGLALKDFIDGRSKTILVAEANRSVFWSQPLDLEHKPSAPLKPLLHSRVGEYHFVLADGTFRAVPTKVSEATLRAAITHAGRDAVGPDWESKP